jgi:MFS transporter, DHA2 family, multidrug resistance protein
MFLASHLALRLDQRKVMACGLLMLGWSLHVMSGWTPDVSGRELLITLVVQGFGMGLVFNPMTVVAFTTLSPSLRGDATSMQALARNVGAAIGISVTTFMLARGVQAEHADLAATVTPFHRLLYGSGAIAQWLDPATSHGAQLLDRMINRQAEIIAYANDYRMMTFVVVPPLLLLLFMRRANRHGPTPAPAPVPAEAD